LREPDLEFAVTQPLGTLAKRWPWSELSAPSMTGSLVSSPVPHRSFHAILGQKYSLLCLVLLSTFLFSSGLGGLFASNLTHWKR